jgi:hypothetical protein
MAYSRRHYRLVSPPPDTHEDVARRLAARDAAARGVADREARYPVLTPGNAREALDYQEQRIRHYEKGGR